MHVGLGYYLWSRQPFSAEIRGGEAIHSNPKPISLATVTVYIILGEAFLEEPLRIKMSSIRHRKASLEFWLLILGHNTGFASWE